MYLLLYIFFAEIVSKISSLCDSQAFLIDPAKPSGGLADYFDLQGFAGGMGNTGSSGSHGGRRRHSSHDHQQQPHQINPSSQVPAPIPQQPPEIPGNRYVFATATPYPPQYPNAPPPLPYYQYASYYPPPPALLPAPYDHHHRNGGGRGGSHYPPNWGGGGGGGRYPYVAPPQPAPYVEHQKAVTIRNDVNLKKETMRVEPDEANPGRFLVAFTFDATVAGR